MAAKKKKRKKTTKIIAKKKAPAKRKVAKAVKAAPKKKTAPKKKVAVKAKVKVKTKAKKVAKRAPNREFGEGNYKASKRFRKSEEAFVKANKAKIPALGKAAEAALEGPEGDSLRAAEAEAASHAAGQD
ncbi:MAG: hypothetical protein WDM86_11400 [Rhizomicrobium sp.]